MPRPDVRDAAITMSPRDRRERSCGSSRPAVTPPMPMRPSKMPKKPAPRCSCSRTTSGKTPHGAEHVTKYAEIRAIAARMDGVWRAKRIPARIAPDRFSRGPVGAV